MFAMNTGSGYGVFVALTARSASGWIWRFSASDRPRSCCTKCTKWIDKLVLIDSLWIDKLDRSCTNYVHHLDHLLIAPIFSLVRCCARVLSHRLKAGNKRVQEPSHTDPTWRNALLIHEMLCADHGVTMGYICLERSRSSNRDIMIWYYLGHQIGIWSNDIDNQVGMRSDDLEDTVAVATTSDSW